MQLPQILASIENITADLLHAVREHNAFYAVPGLQDFLLPEETAFFRLIDKNILLFLILPR